MAIRKFDLKKAINPTMKDNTIVKDQGVGGIKLEYRVEDEFEKHQTLYFMKPYKEHFTTSKKECGKNEYGNVYSPFANVWFCSPIDYKELKEIDTVDFRMSLSKVTDQFLISQLNKQSKSFILIDGEDKEKLGVKPIKKRIKFIQSILQIIKN